MSSPTIISIDPGFDRAGVAVLGMEKDTMILLHSECIITNPKDSRDKRLLQIGARVDKIIKEWSPQELAIEKLFFNANTTSAIGVAEARGVIMFQGARAGLTVFEYSPQEVKIAVTGYGKADKEQVESMTRKLVKIPATDKKRLDDELDAIALGITHLASRKSI
jgi:crossover junction endodeoxyribonuclease RuvC